LRRVLFYMQGLCFFGSCGILENFACDALVLRADSDYTGVKRKVAGEIMSFEKHVMRLIAYGENCGLLPACERDYAINRILALFHRTDFDLPADFEPADDLEIILADLLDDAAQMGLLEENTTLFRDLFDTELMNCLTPRPSQVISEFEKNYALDPCLATDVFYKFSRDTDYIRRYRIKKDIRWTVPSAYGEIELSINLSKPEKDPRAIALAAKSGSGYPKCQLCMENVGYAGRLDHPARATHRVIPIKILKEDWAFQYSPYVYYDEHCIVLNQKHVPMRISKNTFEKLLDFVRQFPHYFLGSNADLPIVGGSILSHDHYQGGRHDFPMAKAGVDHWRDFRGVKMGMVNWPMSVLRLKGADIEALCAAADHILAAWRAYSDPQADIFAFTGDTPHNTITPIARKNGEAYELDLVLRNNRTDEAHPLGIFHPHEEKHHIKKENIGLIEVMGLAILPARLKKELALLAEKLKNGQVLSGDLEKHAPWAQGFEKDFAQMDSDEIFDFLLKETGRVFVGVLEDAGVFKRTPAGLCAFSRFIDTL